MSKEATNKRFEAFTKNYGKYYYLTPFNIEIKSKMIVSKDKKTLIHVKSLLGKRKTTEPLNKAELVERISANVKELKLKLSKLSLS